MKYRGDYARQRIATVCNIPQRVWRVTSCWQSLIIFTGYNFESLQEIAPYLEPHGSGITSLWARTIALKHNTSVVVGYPEKSDVPGSLQGGPEYFNSAILVNSDGETITNYRKTFLYPLDETWACEGTGFFGGHITGLGNTAIGICKLPSRTPVTCTYL